MKVVEKFESLTEHLISDPRVAKYGMMIVKHGFKGAAAKVNPVALYIDAGLSVLEAASSYFRYAKERERTKQILIENSIIESELKSQLEMLKIKGETLRLQGEERIDALHRHLEHSDQQAKHIVLKLNTILEQAKSLQISVRKEREDNLSFTQIIDYQKKLDIFLISCIPLINTSFE